MTDVEILHGLLDKARHMVVGVTQADGTPWAVPVAIRKREGVVFEWVSHQETVHSRAICAQPVISLTIFSIDDDLGFYAVATAEEVAGSARADGYARYRAAVTRAWLNEAHRKRSIQL